MQKSNIEKFKELLIMLYGIIAVLTFLFVAFGRGCPSDWIGWAMWCFFSPLHMLYAALWPLYWLIVFRSKSN